MKPFSFPFILVLLIIAAPVLYLAVIWGSIPDTVPLHYNLHMQPDKTGPKSSLFMVALLLAGVSLLAYLLMKNVHRIDPLRYAKTSPAGFGRLALVIVVFITILNLLIVVASSSRGHHSLKLMQLVLGLLFVFIGNYLPSLKPNYFAGFRLPWTLSNENNWRQTHQLAGKLWFWGGLVLAIAGIFIPSEVWTPVFVASIIILSLIPCVYSYRLFEREKATRS